MRNIELGWEECAHELREKAAARLEIDECERYLDCINAALSGSPELRRLNKDMGVWPSPCGRKIAIVKDWEDVIEMEYGANTIKYMYFILCLCEKDMNVALEYLLLNLVDSSLQELSPEFSVGGAS